MKNILINHTNHKNTNRYLTKAFALTFMMVGNFFCITLYQNNFFIIPYGSLWFIKFLPGSLGFLRVSQGSLRFLWSTIYFWSYQNSGHGWTEQNSVLFYLYNILKVTEPTKQPKPIDNPGVVENNPCESNSSHYFQFTHRRQE